jgi:membrane protein implicated in regulation of membrane protease activity
MYERIAILLVNAFYLYALLGVVFALAFVTVGVKRVDSQANGSGIAFRLLIFPGSVAFWPVLLRRWIARRSEPPEERNPHR